jgi:hypothetical protein
MALNSPGVPGSNLPAGEDHIMRRLADIERRMREMQAADILKPAGLFARPNGMTVAGELDVSGLLAVTGPATIGGTLATTGATTIGGTLGVTGPATIGGTLNVTGTTTLGATTGVTGALNVSGPMAVTGTLSLPAGIINNAALANQVLGAVAAAVTNTGWATTTAMASKAGTSITVPAGFTSALVTALGMVVFVDTAPNRFDCRIVIEGTAGPTIITLASNAGSASPNQTKVVPVVGGQVLNIDVQVLSVAATAGNAANQASITASVVFLR